MRSPGLCVVGLVVVFAASPAATISVRIDRIFAASPDTQQAHWGINVVDLKTGAVVYEKNANRLFVPASTTKLFSTALALSRLGPDHQFRTTITAPDGPDASGRVAPLRFVGGGDPNLSGRVLPYQFDSEWLDPLRYIDQFAQELVDKGLRWVDGDIVGDDSAYQNEQFPEGWALDDPVYAYGAPPTALIINDGQFTVQVAPTTPGLPPNIDYTPAVEGMILHNRAVTDSTTKLKFVRLPGTPELMITGVVSEATQRSLGMEDPALFAAQALRQALLKRGVRVSGIARVEHFPAPGVALVTHTSVPLIEDLRAINKESVNLHAEILLLEVARVLRGSGTREGGLDELRTFLKDVGVPDRQYHFEDGSGLSRHNLVSPSAATKLLLHMYSSPHREKWIDTLPIGGTDGTLAKRFTRTPRGKQIRAKTGSFTHVNALAGYAGRYAFSIMVNNSAQQAGQVRRVMDQIALTLVR